MDRTILHADLNSCYASIELLHRPALRGSPFAVGGDVEARHGIILAKNDLAKKFGVKTGDTIWQAKQKCPGLITVPPDFDLYWRFCRRARQIYGDYSDRVQPFGLDECWIDLTGTEHLHGNGQTVADVLRARVKRELGLTISVGVSFNKIFAKLGSDMKKPNATTVIDRTTFKDMVWPLPAGELLYVGPATQRKLAMYGIHTIGAVANLEPTALKSLFGVMGLTLYDFANGYDRSPVIPMGEEAAVQSVGNSITTPRDLTGPEDMNIVLLGLCESIAARLRKAGLASSCVAVSVRDNQLFSSERQSTLEFPADQTREIYEAAQRLLASHNWARPIRSLGVRAASLTATDGLYIQGSLFRDELALMKARKLETAVDSIRARFGNHSIRRALTLLHPELSAFDAETHTIHPVGYF